MSIIKQAVKTIRGDYWQVRRTIWPYNEGWGVYNAHRHTILEHGLTKERAQQICDEQNKRDALTT